MKTAENWMHTIVVGLDIGHSSVKITFDTCSGTERRIFPSLVFPAMLIRNKFDARLAAAETVQIDERNFFVGKTALLQAGKYLSMIFDDDWIRRIEYRALLAMASKLIDESISASKRLVVLGLPVFQYEIQRQLLAEVAKKVLGESAEIIIVPQPVGGYQTYLSERRGEIKSGRSIEKESFVVVDVGYCSTDIMLLQKGKWIAQASGSCGGVLLAVEHLQRLLKSKYRINADFLDAEKALRCGLIKYFGETIALEEEVNFARAMVARHVTDKTMSLIEHYFSSIDGILVTGGGGEMVLSALQDRCPLAQLIEDTHPVATVCGPQFVNSEGYYRLGRSVLRMRHVQRWAA